MAQQTYGPAVWLAYDHIEPNTDRHWFSDPIGWDPSDGWVWTFTAYPAPSSPEFPELTSSVEITEVFLSARAKKPGPLQTRRSSTSLYAIMDKIQLITASGFTEFVTGKGRGSWAVKVLVVHDQQGKIRSVSLPAAQAPGFEMRLGLKSRSDEMVSEVEVSDIERDKIHECVRDIVAHFRIADHPNNPKLVKE